jgi:hypothetical protein
LPFTLVVVLPVEPLTLTLALVVVLPELFLVLLPLVGLLLVGLSPV